MQIKSLDDFARENVLPVYLTEDELTKLKNKGAGMTFSESHYKKDGIEMVSQRVFIQVGEEFYGYKRIKNQEEIYTIHMKGSIDTKFEDTNLSKQEKISYAQDTAQATAQTTELQSV